MSEFDKHAATYTQALDRSLAMAGESSEYFSEYKAAWIERLLARRGPTRILDFGCGVGTLASALARRRPRDRIDGFDVSMASLERVEPLLRARGLFAASLDELPRDYELIVLSNVLHHIPPPARQATIDDLAARLAPSGMLLVIEHNPLNPLTRWVVAHCDFDDDAVLLWPGEVRRLFAAAQLRDPRRDYLLFFPKLLSVLRRFEPALRWCPAGAQYALLARKAA